MRPVEDLGNRLRAVGGRMTPQRQRVYDAVAAGAHVTPEVIVARIGEDGGKPLPPSTVYRALEALEALGVVGHTHLDHHAPTYHLAGHSSHIHLVCQTCGRVQECEVDLAAGFNGNVEAVNGFVPDMTHMAVHGQCAECAHRSAP